MFSSRKFEEKYNRKKIEEKENKFKHNKLFLHVSSNLFYLFSATI